MVQVLTNARVTRHDSVTHSERHADEHTVRLGPFDASADGHHTQSIRNASVELSRRALSDSCCVTLSVTSLQDRGLSNDVGFCCRALFVTAADALAERRAQAAQVGFPADFPTHPCSPGLDRMTGCSIDPGGASVRLMSHWQPPCQINA